MKDNGLNIISDTTKKKAELIHCGEIFVPDSVELPFTLSSSTAGPGAGKKALALSFGETRIKLGVTKDRGVRFSLSIKGDNYQILKEGEVFIEDVKIIPTLLHAPNQAFINLMDGCIYSCEFCATPRLESEEKKSKSTGQAIKMILEASKNKDFQSVAITSGIIDSPEETLNQIIEVVKKVRENLGDVEIGVEPYVLIHDDIDRLHQAGATEIKLNIESFDREIFKRICPELYFDQIIEMLKYSASVFGKGKVTTNIIIGLGETDENVLAGVEFFARLGIVPVIRVLRINDNNYSRIVNALGHDIQKVSPERMIRLAEGQKEALEKHGLSTGTFDTMCHACGCCDIVPFKDV
jgi:biotin synthase-related radical SAM superfamily protein